MTAASWGSSQITGDRRQLLEYQADQIEMVLQTHRAFGRVMGGTVTPGWIRYQVTPALGTKVTAISKLSEEIALRLGAGAVRISRQGANIFLEVPRADAQGARSPRSRVGAGHRVGAPRVEPTLELTEVQAGTQIREHGFLPTAAELGTVDVTTTAGNLNTNFNITDGTTYTINDGNGETGN